MLDNPLVSVIVPVYNVEKYVRRCLESIAMQTYQPLQIIVIDDGSQDASGNICDEFQKLYQDWIVIHKENGGLSDARNTGIEIAEGEYISFIDSDDFLSPFFYEIMLGCILRDKTDIVALAHSTPFWDEDGEESVQLAADAEDYQCVAVKNTEAIEPMLYMEHVTGAQLKIYKKQIFNGVRFPKGYLYEDVATTYRLFLEADRISIVTASLYAYRRRADSIVRQTFSEKKMVMLEITDKLMADIREKAPELTNAAAARCFAGIFGIYLQIPKREKALRKKAWEHILRYRKFILTDRSPRLRRKDKIAAIVTFLGMDLAYEIGRRYGQKGTMYR